MLLLANLSGQLRAAKLVEYAVSLTQNGANVLKGETDALIGEGVVTVCFDEVMSLLQASCRES